MSINEWTATVVDELQKSGFDVSTHAGFPLVKTPIGIQGKVRLLNFKPSLPAERRVYQDGLLFMPFCFGDRL